MIKHQVDITQLALLEQVYEPILKDHKQPQRVTARRKYSDEESFQPQYHQIKRMGLKVNKKKIYTGGWSSHQNLVYLKFMLQNAQEFLNQKNRRKCKVFYRLSKILKMRTPDQCRSHHQKLQIKFKDDLNLIIHEVHTKIQKALAEDFVNEQFRLQKEEVERMIQMSTMASNSSQEVLQKQAWYQISRKGSSLRIVIDEAAIKSW